MRVVNAGQLTITSDADRKLFPHPVISQQQQQQ